MNNLPWLYFKNSSSIEHNLYITGKGSYKGAARDISYQSIPGRSGDLIIDNGRYNNITIPYELALLTPERDFAEMSHIIKAWLLAEPGYFKLWDSYDESYYRLASYSSEADIEQELRDLGKLSVSFECKPFKYSFEGQRAVTLTAAESLYNAEEYNSNPYIKITGSGNITLSINNSSFYFTSVDGYIEIDSEIMNAYKGAERQNNKMTTPEFPTLAPGANAISWAGSVSSVEIVPRWCCL